MKVVHTLLLASLVAVSGCDSDTTEPEATSIIETFASRLQEKGSAWRSVTVPRAGDVTMQLVSLTQVDAKMNLGIGTISGTQCVILASVDTVANASAVAPQLVRTVSQGTYCVRLADIGNLTQLVDFSVRIERPF
jgi:hypothetical protein